MPIATLSPDIDPTLSPLAAEFPTDAEGRAMYVDVAEEKRPDDGHASATASDALQRLGEEGQP